MAGVLNLNQTQEQLIEELRRVVAEKDKLIGQKDQINAKLVLSQPCFTIQWTSFTEEIDLRLDNIELKLEEILDEIQNL